MGAGNPNEEKWHPDGSPGPRGEDALPEAQEDMEQAHGAPATAPGQEGADQTAEPPPGEEAGEGRPGRDSAVLQAELEAAREEARTYLDRLARLQAEYENYRRRAQREREEAVRYGNINLIREWLPILDNLERALAAAAGEGASVESLRAGVEMTARQFREALQKAGVVPVDAGPGVPFDPHVHEAVLQEEGDSELPTVVEELQKGYLLGERLVRPALVRVTRRFQS